jgi:Arc/MetJ-type ribon-helix-helix transcriptional regulator
MGVVQVQLPDELKSVIDRQVAEGRAASEAAYVTEALRLTRPSGCSSLSGEQQRGAFFCSVAGSTRRI